MKTSRGGKRKAFSLVKNAVERERKESDVDGKLQHEIFLFNILLSSEHSTRHSLNISRCLLSLESKPKLKKKQKKQQKLKLKKS